MALQTIDSRRRLLILVPLLGSLLAPAVAAPVDPRQQREQAVLRARAGETGPALETLRALYARQPSPPVLQDLVAVAHWHGDDALASEFSARLDLQQAPAYAVKAAAQALRNTRQFAAARQAFAACARRWPQAWACRLSAALTLAEQGRIEPARAELEALAADYPRPAELQAALGYVHRLARNWAAAALAYQAAGELEPQRREYHRLAVLSLLDLGAPARAQALAEQDPQALTEADRQRLRGELAARAARWAELPPEAGESRFARTDLALALLEERVQATAGAGGFPHRRARFDHLAALRQRERMDEVIAAFEALQREGAELPPYVLNAAGDAYLAQRRPREAIALYERSLAAAPGQPEIQLARVYACVEAERFEEALSSIDALAAAEPTHRAGQPNPYKLRLDTLSALVRAYADEHAQAQSRLEPLVAGAPLAAELRATLASVYRWRGWPRRAEQEYRIALSIDPQFLDARLGLAGTWLDRQRYARVAETLTALRARYPEDKRVERLEQDWRRERGWQLSSQAAGGRSSGNAVASEEWTLATRLYSPLLTPRLRAYGWQYHAHSQLPEGDGRYRRLGLGLDYRFDGLRLYGGVQAEPQGDQAGLVAGAAWSATDHWSFSLGYDSRSVEVPVRAFWYGIHGSELQLGLGYRWSELRRLDLGLAHLEMSDGNSRQSLSASLRQRLYTAPALKLDGALGAYASENSRQDAPYFNPREDLSVGVSLSADHLTWRHYEHAFSQQISAGIAQYYQQDFGAAPIYDLGYRHDWKLGEGLRLHYGLSWRSRVYDGQRERHGGLFGGLDWSF